MPVVLLDSRYFVGTADLTGQSNKIEFDDSMEEKDVTNFASDGAKEVMAGLESVSINAEGQWEAGDPGKIDDEMWASRRVVEAHTTFPYGADAGDLAYFTRAVRTSAKLLGAVGDVAPWSLSAMGSDPLLRGPILAAPGTTVTSDGDGTAVQHVAVTAGQRLWGVAHVYSYTGLDSLDITVQSDTVGTMDGSPETRLTFGQFTDVGWDFQRTDVGAHADTWYQVSYDVEGSGSALVVVAIGVY